MIVSEKTLKWAMRLYPPLFFQRIWVMKFHRGFHGVTVKIGHSILNRNYNRSIFGGTIFSAADPFYALLFDQIMRRRGLTVRVWLKSAKIDYLKPGRSNLYFNITLDESQIAAAEHSLRTTGKFIKAFPMEIRNKNGEICATVMNEVYIRNLHAGETDRIAY